MANWWDKYETAPEPAKAATPKTAGNWWDKYEQADPATSRRGNRNAETSEQAYARRQQEESERQVEAARVAEEQAPDRWQNSVARGVGTLGESTVQAGGVAIDAAAGTRNFLQRGLSHWSGNEPDLHEPNAALEANKLAQAMREQKDELFPAPKATRRLERELGEAKGFVDTLGTFVRNPAGTLQKGVEMLASSAPAVRIGGAVGGGAVLAGGGAGVDAGTQFDKEVADGTIHQTKDFRVLADQHGPERALELLKARRISAVTAAGGVAGGLLAGATRGVGLNPTDEIIVGQAAKQGAIGQVVREGAGEVLEEVPTQIATNLAASATGSNVRWNDQLGEAAAGGLALGSAASVPVAAASIPGSVRNLRETIRQASSFGDIDRRNTIDFTPDRAAEITSRILPADPDTAAGADLVNTAMRSAGVGSVSPAASRQATEQDDLDAALTRQFAGVELAQQREGGDGTVGNLQPEGIGGARLVRPNANASADPDAPDRGRDSYDAGGGNPAAVSARNGGRNDALQREASGGTVAAQPARIADLPDGSFLAFGDPADLRARLTAAGVDVPGYARVADGEPAVRFPAAARSQVEGVLGGSYASSAQVAPSAPAGDSFAIPRLAGMETGGGGTLGLARPADDASGNAPVSTLPPTQTEASVDGRVLPGREQEALPGELGGSANGSSVASAAQGQVGSIPALDTGAASGQRTLPPLPTASEQGVDGGGLASVVGASGSGLAGREGGAGNPGTIGAGNLGAPQRAATADDQALTDARQRFRARINPAVRRDESVRTKLEALRVSGQLSDEQARIVRETLAPDLAVPTDRVTTFFRSEDLPDTMRAAQDYVAETNDDAAYGELDFTNLGGLNKAMGSAADADTHLAAVTRIIKDGLTAAGIDSAVNVRKGGDEFGVIATGIERVALGRILLGIRQQVADYAAENGLSAIPHAKDKTLPPGIGIHFGTANIEPGADIDAIRKSADTVVERRKQGADYDEFTGPTGTAGDRSEDQPRGTEPGTRTDLPRVVGSNRQGEGGAQGARAEPADPDEPRPVDLQPRDDAGRFTTSTKNAVTDAEREAAGKEPRKKSAPKSNEEALEEARDLLAKQPSAADVIVARLQVTDVGSVSLMDEAVLLAAKRDLINKRNAAAARASDTTKSNDREFGELEAEIRRTQAKLEFEELEAKISAIDQATYASGREWGRMGQLRQQELREDFTFAALERKKRVQEGRPLTLEESAELKVQAEKFEALKKAHEETKRELEEARANSGAAASYEQLVHAMAKQLRGDQRRKRPLLETLRKAADESRAALRAPSQINKKQGGAVDVAAFYHLARIGAFHVAEIGVKFADWTADVTADWTRRMKGELGSRIWRQHEDAMPDVLKAAHLQIEAATKDQPKTSPESVLETIDGDVSHNDVYKLAQAHVLAGVHGEKEVMAAVTKSLQKVAEGITEREVRRLFSEYGMAKFPSKQADKVELRELRALVQMQESIDRLEEGLPALKSGVQRDKQTQLVRERRVQLNERLKALEAKTGADPEKLASYQDARIANLKHQIEDLDKQLKTGERPERKPPPEPTAEIKRLTDERDALREKIIEADRAKNPGETPEQKYLRQRERELQKQIEALRARVDAGAPPKAKPEAKPTDPKIEALKERRDALSAQLAAIEKARRPVRDPEERYQTTRGRAIAREIEKIEARMAAGDYERSVKPLPRELDEKNTQAAFELQKAKYEYARRQFMIEMAKRSPLSKILGTAGEAFNLARSLMTSLDFSAVLRQGGFIAFGHPVRAARSIMPMLRSFASQQAAFAVDAEIKARPNARLYQQAKLELTESNSYDLTKMEEVFMSRWLEKSEQVPGQAARNVARGVKNVVLAPIRGSGRAYVAFMNKLRADSFDAMLAALALKEKPSLAEAEAVASYINVATGRGKIGFAKDYAAGLNTIFFAPRLVASRFNLLFGQPLYGGTNRTRFMVAKEYARFAMGVGLVYALAAAAQDDDDPAIGLDPRSTDFGKIRFGNTRIDPWAGLQQVTVFLARSVTGESVAVTGRETVFRGEDKAYSPPDVLKNFIRSKLAPVPGSLVNLYYGENMIGEPATVGGEALNLVTPMSAGTIKDVMVEHGVAEGTAIALLSIFGMGVNNFDPDKKNN